MKLKYLLIAFLLLSSSFALAQETSIYDFVNNVKSDPASYTMVIGSLTDNNEIKSASSLASSFRITSSRFDTEVTKNQKLIVIGNPSVNKLTQSLLGEWTYGENKALIKVVNNNLIIAGSKTTDTPMAIELIKDYEKNKNKLQTSEYVVSESFSPLTSPTVMLIVILAALIGVPLLISIFVQKKKSAKIKTSMYQEVKQPQQPSPEQQAMQYIQLNLRKGYSKEQIKQALLNVGWQPDVLENIFARFR